MLLAGGSASVSNCIFRHNTVQLVEGNVFAPLAGGAVWVWHTQATFTNCLFYGNTAIEGGAIVTTGGGASFINCTIVGNTATYGRGGGISANAPVTLVNTIVWDNVGSPGMEQFFDNFGTVQATYCDIEGGWAGTGNIDSDPLFMDQATYDFRLKFVSPCKNAGDTASIGSDGADIDWDGNLTEDLPLDARYCDRAALGSVDIGAFEFVIGCTGAGSGVN